MPAELDPRTVVLLDALRDPGARILHALLTGHDATESELLEKVGGAQSTANRRLEELARVGLIVRKEPGKPHTPNRKWSPRHQTAARKLLLSAIDLATWTADEEARARTGARLALTAPKPTKRGG
jgi:DNA-binding transcriptional ArsR family regulator